MKKLQISAGFVSAFLFSLGCNSPTTTENKDSADEHHDHPTTGVVTGKDTAEISLGQEVFFTNIKEGDKLKSPLIVKFGVKGMNVESAEKGVNKDNGHHHLLVDTVTSIAAGALIPMIENKILHFGKGQTETTLELKPGKHTLTLQFGNGIHASFGSRMAKTVHITIQ